MLKDVLSYLPNCINVKIIEYIKKNPNTEDKIEEIRLRCGKNVSLKMEEKIQELNIKITREIMQEAFENICEKSVYSYTNQIAEGFITLKGGNRVGLTGSAVVENNRVINLNYISSLNFRISKQIENCSIKFLKYIIDIDNNSIFNTLIASTPGAGKTTLIRDLTKKLSNGIPEINFSPKICGLVDERGEIAAMHKGEAQNDIGNNTDVIENISKEKGIIRLIRSMSPEIIICDEIGKKEDFDAIKIATCSGVKGIFTAHHSSIDEVYKNKNLKELIDNNLIQRIIILDPKNKGKIKETN